MKEGIKIASLVNPHDKATPLIVPPKTTYWFKDKEAHEEIKELKERVEALERYIKELCKEDI